MLEFNPFLNNPIVILMLVVNFVKQTYSIIVLSRNRGKLRVSANTEF